MGASSCSEQNIFGCGAGIAENSDQKLVSMEVFILQVSLKYFVSSQSLFEQGDLPPCQVNNNSPFNDENQPL